MTTATTEAEAAETAASPSPIRAPAADAAAPPALRRQAETSRNGRRAPSPE